VRGANSAVPRQLGGKKSVGKKTSEKVGKKASERVGKKRSKQGSCDTPESIVECMEISNVVSHLQAFQDIADEGDGTRYWTTLAYDKSGYYIGGLLEDYGYNVTYQPLELPQFVEGKPAELSIVSPTAKTFINEKVVKEGGDFADFLFCGAGSVTAQVEGIDIVEDPASGPTTSGCETEDFSAFVPGNIALIQFGGCGFNDPIANAVAAGASAVIMFNQGTEGREGIIAVSRLQLEPMATDIPVLATTYAVGVELIGTTATVVVEAVTTMGKTFNIIAETYGGDPENVLVLGAHLDSEILGPGMEDDGTGSAALVETAIQFANADPVNKIRFAWWAAEEVGLVGSTYYVESLSDDEVESIIAYLNYDMIGSPNWVIYLEAADADGGKGPADIIREYYITNDIPWDEGFGGVCLTDPCAFFTAGIPYADTYTGSSEIMTEEQVDKYGGIAGEAHDPCYHLACDTIDNIGFDILEINSKAMAYTTVRFAMMESPRFWETGRRRARGADERKLARQDLVDTCGDLTEFR
jgi:Zn-dependent M28 family amino/carboxypeptidase